MTLDRIIDDARREAAMDSGTDLGEEFSQARHEMHREALQAYIDAATEIPGPEQEALVWEPGNEPGDPLFRIQMPAGSAKLLAYGASAAQIPVWDGQGRVNGDFVGFCLPSLLLALYPKYGTCLRTDFRYELMDGFRAVAYARAVAALLCARIEAATGMSLEEMTDYYDRQMIVGFKKGEHTSIGTMAHVGLPT